MFLTHIAFSLELIALGIGALLVLKCCKYCNYGCTCTRETVTPSADPNLDSTRKTRKHFGFLKFLGYLIIILSVLGLICTSISYAGYMGKHGFDDMYHHNSLRNSEPAQKEALPEPMPPSDIP